MRRDSIFYSLFKQSPSLLFEWLDEPPTSADQYRFESVAVKEPKFEIDGVFLPPASGIPGTVFFAEFQMQKDEQLYERLFGESFLYFRQNRQRFDDWQAVLIYQSRATEQTTTHPYRALLNSDQVHRVYLNELGEMDTLPLALAALKLTIINPTEAVDRAKRLIYRANEETSPSPPRQVIIDIVSSIITYMFTTLSRQEVSAMLGISLEQTRVYREAKEEGQLEEQQKIALHLLRKNYELAEIAEITGLSIEQLQELQTQLQIEH
jgi:predicted transposase/invertase (TIGR01784 family)